MCVIAFSPKGVNIPSIQQLKTMWASNPDGAGYAFVNKKGKVVYKKGFMKLEDLLNELQAPERFKNTCFAVHFRIGTSGKNDPMTCHPFPISNNFGELRKTEGEEDSVLFHNGVLSEGGVIDPLSSDTQDFVVAVSPMLKKFSRSKARDYFVEELITGSRLLVLYKNNKFKMYGEWKKDGDVFVSNTNYQHPYIWSGSGYYTYNDCPYSFTYEDDNGAMSWENSLVGNDKTTENKTVVNDAPINTHETRSLWSDIIRDYYKYITDAEIDLLKQSSEKYTRNTLYLNGYVLGYDMSQALVWLEETPINQEDGEEE